MISKIKKYFSYKKFYKLKDNTTFDSELQVKEKPYLEIQNNIAQEKKEIKQKKREIKQPSQSKMFLLLLLFNFSILEGFVGYVTIKSLTIALTMGLQPDFSPLITLISLVIGETISYGIYTAKSKAENVKGGIVYDCAMKEYEQKEENDYDIQ